MYPCFFPPLKKKKKKKNQWVQLGPHKNICFLTNTLILYSIFPSVGCVATNPILTSSSLLHSVYAPIEKGVVEWNPNISSSLDPVKLEIKPHVVVC